MKKLDLYDQAYTHAKETLAENDTQKLEAARVAATEGMTPEEYQYFRSTASRLRGELKQIQLQDERAAKAAEKAASSGK